MVPRRPRNPDPSTTLLMHASKPKLVIRSQLTVRESGEGRLRRRSSTGSRPSSSATLSKWVSRAKRGCGVRWSALGAQGGWFEAKLFRNFVERGLQGEARLRRAVASLGATGRLVREQPDTFESISRNGIGGRLEDAGVVGAGDRVAAVVSRL